MREIPMRSDVKNVLLTQKDKRTAPVYEPFVVDGYTGFIFLNRNGKAFAPAAVFDAIQGVVRSHNQYFWAKGKIKNRAAFLKSAHTF